jgi:membrane-bound lytic murein transglycosylase D
LYCFTRTAIPRLIVVGAAIFFLSSCAQTPVAPPAETPKAESSEKSYNQYDTTFDMRLAIARDLTMFPEAARDELVELPPPETDLWEVIVNGYAIPDLDGALVEKWERWYADRPDYVERMIERSRLFLYHIVHEIEARQMPMEIALLPMIESAYNPNALSRSSASGIWQFIPSTGKHYGLKQNWWMDERRDVLSATDSALNYLQKLYGDFTDWHLALAAYNWGEGSVSRALAKNRASKKPETYAALKMPNETKNYVPKLQAVKNIIRDPGKYGLTLADIPDAPYFTVVKTMRKMDVDMAVSLAEMSKEEFLALNPQHNRPVIAGANEFTLLLPIDKANIFASKLDLVDQPLVTWQAYRIQKGETLAQVADKFNMTPEALRAVNGLGSKTQVREGLALLVPAEQPSAMTEVSLVNTVFTTVPSTRTMYYKVKKGDTLSGIAKRYGVDVQALMRLNGIKKPSALRAGKNIRVMSNAPVYTARQESSTKNNNKRDQTTTHTVQKGDTLSGIAKHYGVTVTELEALNHFDKKVVLRIGQNIQVAASSASSKTVAKVSAPVDEKSSEEKPQARSAVHIVRQGDTLSSIAAHYQVSVNNLLRWNRLTKKSLLRIGQRIVIEDDGGLGKALAIQSGKSEENNIIEVVGSGRSYRVQEGDTLGQIARAHGTTIKDLMRWNDIKKPTTLRAGQMIRVSYHVEPISVAKNDN